MKTFVDIKHCHKCSIDKPLSQFGKDKYRSDGLTTSCKQCRNIRSKEWNNKNKDKVSESNFKNREKRKIFYSDSATKLKYRSLDLYRRFGLTHEDYEKILKKQHGVCAICQQNRLVSNKSYMCIDHCHKTGEIRGILCNWCNKALGLLNDNKDTLKRAIEYLTKDKL